MISPYRLWVQAKGDSAEYKRLLIKHGCLILKEKKMGYKIQEHQATSKEFVIYETASNGELCRRIASFGNKADAENILDLIIKADKDVPQDS